MIVPGRKAGTHMTPTGESTLRGVLAISAAHQADLDVSEMAITDVHHLVRRMIAAGAVTGGVGGVSRD